MASSNTSEIATQSKTCRCAEGDTNIRTTMTSDNPDKQLPKCSNCQIYKSGTLFISSKGYFLNPQFRYATTCHTITDEVRIGLKQVIKTLLTDPIDQIDAITEIDLFNDGFGSFGDPLARRAITRCQPRIGWTSWKKRWFILTRTSLVFYRSDPNATPQKGSEANLTLGGIDLNSSGSIVVKADKKLLTVLFPDGRDGRTFTLKAETSEDLYEWKTALENALAQAPSAALALGQNGIFRNDIADSIEASFEQWRDRRPVKSSVVGRPILLALEDIDGSPSFLEKALRFIEEHGIKVEGILRQSADVEEVERRVQEYEQGKNEFSPHEDAHVIGDCIKHVLRELPSSPVPASCCTALVEAYRTDRGSRINAMHAAITETFPEPNRRLVQRILKMMRTVASHKSKNRMTLPAVAACMAPLLLRPLLAGDCELEDDFNMGGDGSIQLLQAAAAANHAQAIVIILLEEYEKIFDEDLLEEGSLSSELYSESEDGDVEDEELTDNDILEEDGYHDADNGLEADTDDDPECSSSGTLDESNSDEGSDLFDHKVSEDHSTGSRSPRDNKVVEVTKIPLKTLEIPELELTSTDIAFHQHPGVQKDGISQNKNSFSSVEFSHESHECISSVHTSRGSMLKSVSHTSPSSIAKCAAKSNEPLPSIKRPTIWGRTSARKNLSMESIDYSSEDEIAIQKLEMTKSDLQTKFTKEVEGNAVLQASLEKRKEALHERRLALEQDVERLREQLQRERDLRSSLEAGLMNLRPGHLLITSSMDSKTRADLEEVALAEADIINLKQKAADLRGQLSHQLQHSYASLCESCSQHLYAKHQSAKKEQQNDVDSTTLVHQNENSRAEDVLSGKDLGNVQAQKQDLPSPNRERSQKQPLMSATRNNTISSGFSGSSSTKELSTTIALSEKPSAKNENAFFQADPEDVRAQTPDSPSSTDMKPLPKQHRNGTDQSSTISLQCSRASYAKEPTTVVRNAAPKKSTSGDKNSMPGADCENVKSRAQDSPSSPDKQHAQKFQTDITSQSGTESLGPSSASSIEPRNFGHETALKKSSPRSEAVKKEHAFQNSTISLGSSSASAEDPTTIVHDATSTKSASRDDNPKPRADCENMKTQTHDSPSSPDKQSAKKLQPKTTNQSGKSLGSNSISSPAEPRTVDLNTTSKKSSFRGETVKKEHAFQNSTISSGSTGASYAKEPTTAVRRVSSKKSASRDEISVVGGVDCNNVKTQNQGSPSSPDKQTTQKLQPNTTNQCGTKSLGSNCVSSVEEPATFGRITALKKSSLRGETLKKENQDPPSLPSSQSSQKQQLNTTNMSSSKSLGSSGLSSEEMTSVGRNAASKKSTIRGEETAPSSSSALTKLTNRLNFLKDRRVQLVSELQNLDTSQSSSPQGGCPPPVNQFKMN